MKNIYTKLFIVVGVLFLVSCGQEREVTDSRPTMLVKDAKYGDQNVPIDPQRIVAFDYGVLDTLTVLGLQEKVIGLPKSNLPALLSNFGDERYANVGNLFEPNYELLYTLKPDLIVVSGRAAAKIEDLRKIAPTIFLEPQNEDYYNTFRTNIELLGKILNKEELVSQKLKEVDEKLKRLNNKVRDDPRTGLISLYTAGKISVYGPRSRFGIIHQAFAVKPADSEIQEAAQHGQVVNFEYIKKMDPDFIFVIDRAKILGEETLAQGFFDNEVIRSTKAYRNGHIKYLDTEIWYTVSGGLQSMSKMIDEIDGLYSGDK